MHAVASWSTALPAVTVHRGRKDPRRRTSALNAPRIELEARFPGRPDIGSWLPSRHCSSPGRCSLRFRAGGRPVPSPVASPVAPGLRSVRRLIRRWPDPTDALDVKPTEQPTADLVRAVRDGHAGPRTQAPAEPSPSTDPAPMDAPAESPSPSPSPTNSVDFVVTFAPGTNASERDQILAGAGAQVVDSVAALRIAVIRVPAGSGIVAELRARDDVLHVERDRVREAEATPNDPGYDGQWSLASIGWKTSTAGVDPAGSAVVAVLDTGVDAAPSGPRWPARRRQAAFVARRRARRVTRTATAPPWPASSPPLPTTPSASPASASGRLGHAGHRAGRRRPRPGQRHHRRHRLGRRPRRRRHQPLVQQPGLQPALQAAIDYAWDHDVVVVAAMGNDGSSAATYPAGDRRRHRRLEHEPLRRAQSLVESRRGHVPRRAGNRHRHPGTRAVARRP